MADEAHEFVRNNFILNTVRGGINAIGDGIDSLKSVINTATHPSKWPSVINSFLHTLGYVANPSNWYNIVSALIAGFLMTAEEEGFGYALGNLLVLIGEEIITDGAITELKVADTGIDVVKFAERSDDAIDVVNSIKRVDNIESTAKRIDSKTIEVTAKDGTKYQYSGRIQNKRYAGEVNPKTGIEDDINGFPIFDSKVTYQLPESYYYGSRDGAFPDLNKQLYLDIESGVVDNPFPEGVDYSSLQNGKMPSRGPNEPYFSWHHNQEPGIMQLVDYNIHNDSRHTGGYAIWGNEKI